MKRIFLRLTLALLTFTIGVTSAFLWPSYRRTAPPIIKIEGSTPAEDTLASRVTKFEPKGSACGYVYVRGGGRFSSQMYESSDGVGVGYSAGDYGSPSRAKKYLREKIKDALQIIERTPKLDDTGKLVGERVVAMYPPNAPFEELGSVFWTDGSHFYVIDSPSLKHTLEFERSSDRWEW